MHPSSTTDRGRSPSRSSRFCRGGGALRDAGAAREYRGRVAEDGWIVARVTVVGDEVGGLAIGQAREPEEIAGGRARRRQRPPRRQAELGQQSDLAGEAADDIGAG